MQHAVAHLPFHLKGNRPAPQMQEYDRSVMATAPVIKETSEAWSLTVCRARACAECTAPLRSARGAQHQ